MDGFTITGGLAEEGGGIYCADSSPTITNCTISNNLANSSGGGIYCHVSSPTVTNCTISNNYAYSDGSGIHCSYSSPAITNCTISENSSEGNGGGIYCYYSSPPITNCTISQNSASGDSSGNNDSSGGIYIRNSSPVITNCIFWANSSGEILVSGGSPSIIYSSVQNGWPGEGNISVNPEFADPVNGDYRLRDYSPCIGAGTSDGAPDSDITGNPRPGPPGSNPDMGAYENNRQTPDVPPLDIFGVQVGNVLTYQGTYPGGSYASESEVTLIDQTTFPTTTHVIEYSVDGSITGRN